MSKFKPCPGCGQVPTEVTKSMSDPNEGPGMGYYYYNVVCPDCGWTSPQFKFDPNRAIEFWNKRFILGSPTVIRKQQAIPKSERLLTFDEWKAEGYYVTKGSKSCGRNEQGKPVFRERDVDKVNRKYGAMDEEDSDEALNDLDPYYGTD